MPTITDNQKAYAFLPKAELESQLAKIGGLDTIINGPSAAVFSSFAAILAAAIKKSIPGTAVALPVLQGMVAANKAALERLISENDKKYSDWCLVITTTYGFTGWKGGYPTYDKIVDVRYHIEAGQD